jgi:hypothetical protein
MKIEEFIKDYPVEIAERVLKLRSLILGSIPGIIEMPDDSAKIIAYGFGPKYSDNICSILLSKKGVKLGFYKGSELPDPAGLLQGSGKVHKYVVIRTDDDMISPALRALLNEAFAANRKRSESK